MATSPMLLANPNSPSQSPEDNMSPMTQKKCSKCGRTLPLSEFEKHNKAKDGYHRFCKECSTSKHKVNTNIGPFTRPKTYLPQQGSKATFTLADFSDENLFAELRRRGYNGTLRYSKVINV